MPTGDIYIPLVERPDPTSPSRHYPSPLFQEAAFSRVMPSSKPRQPHLAWPPRLAADGSIGVVEQASEDHAIQSVALLLSTPAGSLIDAPSMGIPDPTHTRTVTVGRLEQIVNRWIPQAAVSIGDQAVNDLVRLVDVAVGESHG